MALSGGVDSAVAAYLLKMQGFDLIGITFNIAASEGAAFSAKARAEIDAQMNDAAKTAWKLNFPHYVVDAGQEFSERIIKNFVSEYLSGKTPNPCVLCNEKIKWEELLKQANKLDCEYIATGHYARIAEHKHRKYIRQALDEAKDQSYFLWKLSEKVLRKTLFPLGDYSKSEIKALAGKIGLDEIAQKKESYNLCFLSGRNYRTFLEEKNPIFFDTIRSGKIISEKGRLLGTHNGFPFYTIGQKIEINRLGQKYVYKIDAKENIIYVGEKERLYSSSFYVKDVNLTKYEKIPKDVVVGTKIRYKDKARLCKMNILGDKIKVSLSEPIFAVCAGQSAVFLEGSALIGGGIIV